MPRYQDISGIKYGKLTALEDVGNKKWRFKCECGNEIIAYADNVKRGMTKSCGCARSVLKGGKKNNFVDSKGEKFGLLTAIEYVGNGKWKCLCECGNFKNMNGKDLRGGRAKSCGCKKIKIGGENKQWKGDDASYAAFHKRVWREKGLAKDYGCSICGRNDDGCCYDWANLTGHYEDINDYAPMCRSCHRKYDKKRRDGIYDNLPFDESDDQLEEGKRIEDEDEPDDYTDETGGTP